MKRSLLIFFASGIFLTSCTKTDLTPQGNSVNSSSHDDATALKTRSALLTGHPWMYKGFYFHYVDRNNKGDAEYVRGASNNALNLDATRYFFKADGTFIEIDGGNKFQGKWNFTDQTGNTLFLNYTYWTETCTILKFTNNQLSYTKPMGYKSLSFTELIQAK
jgi:hypothetical protein